MAEISIGILGFTAIVSALSTPRSRGKHSEAHFRMLWFLDRTLLLIAASVLPFAVFQWVESEVSGWRIAAALAMLLGFTLQIYRLRVPAYLPWVKKLPKPIFFIFGPGDIFLVVTLIAMALGAFVESQARMYTLVLYYLLAYSIFGFVYFVELIWKEDDPES
ncbi:MAG: hypothetical protein VX252_14780 [Myxococcota bacterium]|nr:hypothetical protein [Myxococcota bacterium]